MFNEEPTPAADPGFWDSTGPIHQVNRQSGREDGSNDVDTDRDPPVQVVEGTRGTRDLVDATQVERFLPERVLS